MKVYFHVFMLSCNLPNSINLGEQSYLTLPSCALDNKFKLVLNLLQLLLLALAPMQVLQSCQVEIFKCLLLLTGYK